jgi:hypothetical protein
MHAALGKRNAAAHPNAVVIDQIQTDAYISDLTTNVVRKIGYGFRLPPSCWPAVFPALIGLQVLKRYAMRSVANSARPFKLAPLHCACSLLARFTSASRHERKSRATPSSVNALTPTSTARCIDAMALSVILALQAFVISTKRPNISHAALSLSVCAMRKSIALRPVADFTIIRYSVPLRSLRRACW